MISTVTVAPLTMSACGGPLPSALARAPANSRGTKRGNRRRASRNADQHDRLVVLDEFQADDGAGAVEGNENADRLARIAGGVDEIGGEIDEADALLPLVHRGDRRRSLHRAETIGAGEYLVCGELGEEGVEQRRARLRERRAGRGNEQHRCQEECQHRGNRDAKMALQRP